MRRPPTVVLRVLGLSAILASACGGTSVAEGPCDLLAQTGCAEGEACRWRPNGSNVCQPDGTVAPNGDCSYDALGHDDCAGGAYCTYAGSDPAAVPRHLVCLPLCTRDADCSTPGTFCNGFAANCPGDASCGRNTPGGFCVQSCRPFLSDCGSSGTCAAIPKDIDGSTRRSCHFAGPGGLGATCHGASDCGKNTYCAETTPQAATCVQLCDGDHACPPGLNCATPENGVSWCR